MRAEENRAEGMSADEANYAAQRQFGNQTLLQEASRDMWAVRFVERSCRIYVAVRGRC
jgi:hypothetical protein